MRKKEKNNNKKKVGVDDDCLFTHTSAPTFARVKVNILQWGWSVGGPITFVRHQTLFDKQFIVVPKAGVSRFVDVEILNRCPGWATRPICHKCSLCPSCPTTKTSAHVCVCFKLLETQTCHHLQNFKHIFSSSDTSASICITLRFSSL